MHTTDDERALSVRLPGRMADDLRELARANLHSVSAEARQALAAHLARQTYAREDVVDRTAAREGELRG